MPSGSFKISFRVHLRFIFGFLEGSFKGPLRFHRVGAWEKFKDYPIRPPHRKLWFIVRYTYPETPCPLSRPLHLEFVGVLIIYIYSLNVVSGAAGLV